MNPELLAVNNLRSVFYTPQGKLTAVDDVSFAIPPRRTLGLVGESGCGKTVTALSILRLLEPPARIESGSILFDSRTIPQGSWRTNGLVDLLSLPDKLMRTVRGAEISMIFQEPSTSLDPVFTVGAQIAETVRAHEKVSRKEAWERAVEGMKAVSIPDAARRAKDYPHQLSGGMRQRVMIAMALVCHPQLVIADEPTTALDVTVQAQILKLLQSMREQYALSMLFISHDLGVIAAIADEVAIMYCGKIVEQAPVEEIFSDPRHPYTQGLLRSLPAIKPGMMPSRKLEAIPGSVPNLRMLPRGCKFEPRCPIRVDECKALDPPLYSVGERHKARCIFAGKNKFE